MRLINADFLENMGYELHRTYREDANTMVYEVKKIADVPTIEVELNSCKYWDSESHFCALRRPQAEPVRRGQWIEEPGMFMCSVCFDPWSIDDEEMIKGFNYCPNCGAKIKEGNDKNSDE